MSSVRVLVGTKKGALILTKQEILDSKADPGLPGTTQEEGLTRRHIQRRVTSQFEFELPFPPWMA
jgi:hypothetical protein